MLACALDSLLDGRVMGVRNTYHGTLVRACSVAGDEVALAKALDVPVESVITWLLGETEVPVRVFLGAVDIVLTAQKKQIEDNKKRIDRTEQLVERIRRKYRR